MSSLAVLDTVVCTLLADGSSDRVLLPILRWLLEQHCRAATELQFVEVLPSEPANLTERISAALDFYPCHLLFVHRDAEGDDPALRQVEVDTAWAECNANAQLVSVIPVRMTEAWLLLDETAIRGAAGNPNGEAELQIPRVGRLEQHRDPKSILFEALRTASGLSPSRLRGFRPESRRHRIAELMETFEPLRQLPSFVRLEDQLRTAFRG
jgi:hypothetical protein